MLSFVHSWVKFSKLAYCLLYCLIISCLFGSFVLRLLQVLLSPFSPNHIQHSLFHRKGESYCESFIYWLIYNGHPIYYTQKPKQVYVNDNSACVVFSVLLCTVLGDDKGSCFSFLRFIDISPAEMSNLMLQGTLARLVSPQHCWTIHPICVKRGKIRRRWMSTRLLSCIWLLFNPYIRRCPIFQEFAFSSQMVSPLSVPKSRLPAPLPAPVWLWRRDTAGSWRQRADQRHTAAQSQVSVSQGLYSVA